MAFPRNCSGLVWNVARDLTGAFGNQYLVPFQDLTSSVTQ